MKITQSDRHMKEYTMVKNNKMWTLSQNVNNEKKKKEKREEKREKKKKNGKRKEGS